MASHRGVPDASPPLRPARVDGVGEKPDPARPQIPVRMLGVAVKDGRVHRLRRPGRIEVLAQERNSFHKDMKPPTSTNSRHPYIDGMRNCVASSTISCRPLVNKASLPTRR